MKMLVVVAVAVAAFAVSADGLKCHQCNSLTDPMCADPFYIETTKPNEEKKLKTDKFLQECPADGKTYTICRKIAQTVRGVDRVIRLCGYEEYKSDCYKTVLEEYNTYVCQCKGDGCNGAVRTDAALAVGIVAALTVVINGFRSAL